MRHIKRVSLFLAACALAYAIASATFGPLTVNKLWGQNGVAGYCFSLGDGAGYGPEPSICVDLERPHIGIPKG